METVLSFAPKPPSLASNVIACQSLATRLPCRFPPPLPRSDVGLQSSVPFCRRGRIWCRSGGGNGSSTSDSGENESKAALDAFFLGKALAEAINERIASNVGEFLSVIGQWQAEQQKQVQDFQEEVKQRAQKTKEKAAAEALGAKDGAFSAPVIKPPPSDLNEDDSLEEMLKD